MSQQGCWANGNAGSHGNTGSRGMLVGRRALTIDDGVHGAASGGHSCRGTRTTRVTIRSAVSSAVRHTCFFFAQTGTSANLFLHSGDMATMARWGWPNTSLPGREMGATPRRYSASRRHRAVAARKQAMALPQRQLSCGKNQAGSRVITRVALAWPTI